MAVAKRQRAEAEATESVADDAAVAAWNARLADIGRAAADPLRRIWLLRAIETHAPPGFLAVIRAAAAAAPGREGDKVEYMVVSAWQRGLASALAGAIFDFLLGPSRFAVEGVCRAWRLASRARGVLHLDCHAFGRSARLSTGRYARSRPMPA
jgi:hypothetical protein